MEVIEASSLTWFKKTIRKSKGIVVAIIGTAEGGAAIKTNENLRARFPKSNVERKITAILQGRSQIFTIEQIVHVIMEHLNLWFYVLDPSKTSTFLVRYPTAEMVLLVFAPVLGLLTGISLTAFTPIRCLRQWSRFWGCGIIGDSVAMVFTFIVRQPEGIYSGMIGYD